MTKLVNSKKVKVGCRCSNHFELIGAYTQDEIQVEYCDKCHPAYTGKQTAHTIGSIEKFFAKFNLDPNDEII